MQNWENIKNQIPFISTSYTFEINFISLNSITIPVNVNRSRHISWKSFNCKILSVQLPCISSEPSSPIPDDEPRTRTLTCERYFLVSFWQTCQWLDELLPLFSSQHGTDKVDQHRLKRLVTNAVGSERKKTPALECIWHPRAKGKLQGKRLEDGEKPLQTNAVAVKQNVFF